MASPMQEYLISLGFGLDNPGFKRFNEMVDSTAKGFVGMAEKSTAAAIAIGVAVEKVASHYEELYFMAQRTGSTVQNLQATAYGFSQVGLAAGDALGIVNNLAMTLRTQPGSNTLLRMLGVGPGDPASQASHLIHVLKDRFGTGPGFFMGAQYGAQFGMAPHDLLTAELGIDKADAEGADYKRRQKAAGIDPDKLGKSSNDLMTDVRRLESEFDILGARIAQDFIDPLDHAVRDLTSLTEGFLVADNAAHGWLSTLAAIGAALGGISAAKATLSWLFGKAAPEASSSAAMIAGAKAAAKWGARLIGGEFAALSAAAGIGDEEALADPNVSRRLSRQDRQKQSNIDRLGFFGGSWEDLKESFGATAGASSQGGGGQAGWWSAARQRHAEQALVNGGLTPLAAAAMVSRWMNVESGGGPGSINPSTGAFGIGQWLGSRKTGIAGDLDFDHQLAYAVRELNSTERGAKSILNAAKTPWDAARGASAFERAEGFNPLFDIDNFTRRTAAGIGGVAPLGSDRAGSSGTVIIHQDTDIHVNGGSDARTTGDHVLAHQGAVNADIVRNAGANVR